MEINPTDFCGLYVITPRVFQDSRGTFVETFNQEELKKHFSFDPFVQDNESVSHKGVLRGLHLQVGEFAQSKLIRVSSGEVFDVCVDLRKNSKTYLKSFATTLSAQNRKQIYIPKGFAHGFLVLSESATFCYKVDAGYSKNHERGIRYDDSQFNISWPKLDTTPIVSEKDLKLPQLNDTLIKEIAN